MGTQKKKYILTELCFRSDVYWVSNTSHAQYLKGVIHWEGAKIWVQKSAGSSECLSQILPLNFPKPFQLAQLEDDFTSLLEGASTDTQKVFSSEMEQIKNQCLKESASLQEEDDGLVPEDYESDDNKTGDEKETDEEEEVCHITKVCVCHF